MSSDRSRSESIRQRSGEVLTLYYYGYDKDRVATEGFREPDLTGYGGARKSNAGFKLTCQPPRLTSYERALTD